MTTWVLLFFMCTQSYNMKTNKFEMTCQVRNYEGSYKTKKLCEAGKKELLKDDAYLIDSSCVKVTVWRK